MNSIIIPTYNHCDDLLKPCIESIIKNTDMSNAEIIVVANGCTDNTKEYLDSMRGSIKTIWHDNLLGFPKAINMGLRVLSDRTKYAVLLNNDVILLNQNKNQWINMMGDMFITNPRVGISGPLKLYDNYVKQYYIQFFCAMIKYEVVKKIGLLDEAFGYGNCEDSDYCLRAKMNGYEIASHPVVFNRTTTMKLSTFPIYHLAHKTVNEIPEFIENCNKNIAILQNRYRDLPPEKFEKENYIT